MSKYIFTHVDKTVLDYHNMADTSKVHYVSAYGTLLPVYLAQDPTKREEIQQILTKPTQKTLIGQGYKKVFLLPNCGVSQDRLKENLKEHGIKLTTDLNEADAVITHNSISGEYQSSANINTKMLLASLWNYYAYIIKGADMTLLYQQEKDEVKYGGTWSWDSEDSESIYEMDYFTGAALVLSYMIGTQNFPVIDVETVMGESSTRQALTHDMLNMLISQINAGGDDRALAFKMLPTIDPDTNRHLLWKLSQECGNEIYYARRDKDLKYWYHNSGIEDYTDYTAEMMIVWLKENNLLTSRAFRYLEPIVRKEIRISNRDLYVFKVAVKPEYREYLKLEKNE